MATKATQVLKTKSAQVQNKIKGSAVKLFSKVEKKLEPGLVKEEEHKRRQRMQRLELIEEHRLMTNDLDTLTTRVDGMVAILINLKETYEENKGRQSCLCWRNNLLADMIEEALHAYQTTLMYSDAMDDTEPLLAASKSGTGDGANVTNNAIAAVEICNRVLMTLNRSNNAVRDPNDEIAYELMDSDALTKEIEEIDKDTTVREQEIQELELKLNKLASDYEIAKQRSCCFRGAGLEKIILEATEDCQ